RQGAEPPATGARPADGMDKSWPARLTHPPGGGTMAGPRGRQAASTAPLPEPAMPTPTRRDLANAIRFLAIDAVQAANSGHPGMPMGMADIAEVLWNDYLSHNRANPGWLNRDRFVLSHGHG